MSRLRVVLLLIGFALSSVLFQNCAGNTFGAPAEFSAASAAGSADGTTDSNGGQGDTSPVIDANLGMCNRTSLQQITTPLKIVLVVDNSGSTLNTDPLGFRQSSLQQLVSTYGSKANLKWQMMLFNGSSAFSLIYSNSQQDPIFSNGAAAQAAVDYFRQLKGAGNTPYLAALSLADKAIRTDPDLSNPEVRYAVMFMSDGRPTDSSDSQIFAAENQILARAPNRITFNTLYFTNSTDPDDKTEPANRLREMARIGKGYFTNITRERATVPLDQVLVIPGSGCLP